MRHPMEYKAAMIRIDCTSTLEVELDTVCTDRIAFNANVIVDASASIT